MNLDQEILDFIKKRLNSYGLDNPMLIAQIYIDVLDAINNSTKEIKNRWGYIGAIVSNIAKSIISENLKESGINSDEK